MAKQTSIPTVDEDFIKTVISQGLPMKRNNPNEIELSRSIKEDEPAIEIPKNKEAPKRKRIEQAGYRETFFEKVDLTDRQSLYITRETYFTMMNVVNVIGGHKATISSYVENVMRQHLESHKEEINSLYQNQLKKLIS
ncbi:MAG: DUF3408 domain-containing protein [Paludibacter sp.]|nr:DUF3408 domain-containing protein [Paludibacter sp.]